MPHHRNKRPRRFAIALPAAVVSGLAIGAVAFSAAAGDWRTVVVRHWPLAAADEAGPARQSANATQQAAAPTPFGKLLHEPASPAEPSARPGAGLASGPGLTAGTRPSVVTRRQLIYLVRSSLLTLNDANRTGNYSVLRDTAGPSFRAGNTTERLARIFAGLKRSRLDLSPVALVAPTLDVAPFVDRNRRLRIKGAFALSAQRIAFDLAYEPAGGEWQLFAISIGARPLGGAGSGSNPG